MLALVLSACVLQSGIPMSGVTAMAAKTVQMQTGRSVTVSEESLELAWGNKIQLHASAGNGLINWTSSNEEVASVDSDGYVTGLWTGTAVIRAASAEDASDYDEVTVTVREKKVACVGDSLTAGYLSSNAQTKSYPARLQTLLGSNCIVRNFGLSSYTLLKGTDRSYWNCAQYRDSLAFQPDVVIIMLGTNDSKAKYWDADQGNGKAHFEQDAIELVNSYKQLSSAPEVIFATSPTVFSVSENDIRVRILDQEIIPMQKRLAEENGWKTIDMHELTADKGSLYNADGVHFTDTGYYYEAECMYQAITGKPYVRDAIPVVRVQGGTEETSSAQNYIKYICDDDYATYWHSAWTPAAASRDQHWITMELEECSMVDGFSYLARQDTGTNGVITEYQLQVSADGGKTYDTVASGTWTQEKEWKKVTFAPVKATHVKFISVASMSNAGSALSSGAELRIHGTSWETSSQSEAKELLAQYVRSAREDYTQESCYNEKLWNTFQETLQKADALLQDEMAASEEINALCHELRKITAKLAESEEDLEPLAAMETKFFMAEDGTLLPYRIYVPEQYEAGKRYPVLLFLHGAGNRGSDNKKHLEPTFFARALRAENRVKYPMIIVAPQCPADQKWVDTDWGNGNYSLDEVPLSNELKAVMELMESVREDYPVNCNRQYVAGFSMGAFAVWDLLMRDPDTFAAAVAVAGAGDPSKADRLKDMPVWGIHGNTDQVVPYGNSTKAMMEALTNAGSSVAQYTEKNAGHELSDTIWSQEDFDVLSWLTGYKKEMETQELSGKVEEAKGVKTEEYTKETADAFLEALAKAEKILADDAASQSEIDAALEDLRNARQGLVKKPVTEPSQDKDPLQPVIPVKPDQGGTNVQPQPEKPQPIQVAAPELLSVRKKGKKLTVSWSQSAGADGYEVSYSTGGGYKDAVETGAASYCLSRAKARSLYAFRVRAYKKSDGKKVWSEYSQWNKKGIHIPKTKIVSLKKNKKSVRMKWQKISGASGYQISRKTGKRGKYKVIAFVKKGKKVSYTDKKIKAGKQYFYKVRAVWKKDGKTAAGAYGTKKKVKF